MSHATAQFIAQNIDTAAQTTLQDPAGTGEKATYTAQVTASRTVLFTGEHARLLHTVEVTRTTSRSVKVFTARVSRELGTQESGYANMDDRENHASHLYNDKNNQVHAAQFDGYRVAAVAHVNAMEAALESTTEDQDTAVEAEVQAEDTTAAAEVYTPEAARAATLPTEDQRLEAEANGGPVAPTADDQDQLRRQGLSILSYELGRILDTPAQARAREREDQRRAAQGVTCPRCNSNRPFCVTATREPATQFHKARIAEARVARL